MRSREQVRDAAAQRRRMAALESSYSRRFSRELSRFGRVAAKAYQNGNMAGVELVAQEHTQELQKILAQLYRDGVAMAERYTRHKFGKKFPMALEKKDAMIQAITLLSEFWLAESFSMSTLISNTTMEAIRATTMQAVIDGLGEDEIAKRIVEVQDSLSLGRARTIARTETHNTIMKSQHDITESMDLPEHVKEWNSGSDGRVRKSHRRADGQLRRPDEPFDIGGDKLMYPGDRSGGPENVINCRCVATSSFDQEDIERAR